MLRLLEVLNRATNGCVVTVSEEQIAAARSKMATYGVYVEITSAVNLAGYETFIRENPTCSEHTFVLPLCGAGIKSL